MLLTGYLLSSVAPVILGLVRDATGSFEAVLWILIGLAVAMFPRWAKMRASSGPLPLAVIWAIPYGRCRLTRQEGPECPCLRAWPAGL